MENRHSSEVDRAPNPPTPEQLQEFERLASGLIKNARYPIDLGGLTMVYFENVHGGQTSISQGEYGMLLPFKNSVEVMIEKFISQKDDVKTYIQNSYAYSPETGETAFTSKTVDYHRGRRLRSESEQRSIEAMPEDSSNIIKAISGELPVEMVDEETAEYLRLMHERIEKSSIYKPDLSEDMINEVLVELVFLEPFDEIQKPDIPNDVIQFFKEYLGTEGGE